MSLEKELADLFDKGLSDTIYKKLKKNNKEYSDVVVVQNASNSKNVLFREEIYDHELQGNFIEDNLIYVGDVFALRDEGGEVLNYSPSKLNENYENIGAGVIVKYEDSNLLKEVEDIIVEVNENNFQNLKIYSQKIEQDLVKSSGKPVNRHNYQERVWKGFSPMNDLRKAVKTIKESHWVKPWTELFKKYLK